MIMSYSSSQIQMFRECPWKYFLTYRQKITWPKPFNRLYRDYEAEAARGEEFHRAIHRILQGLGTASDRIEQDDTVRTWIKAFIELNPIRKSARVYSEFELTAMVGDSLWSGKFDCIAIEHDAITIYDWKTSQKPLNPKILQTAPQTRLYPFLLAANLDRFNSSGNLNISSISMVYWNPNFPASDLKERYHSDQYKADAVYLQQTAGQLSREDAQSFPKTGNLKTCSYCRFQTRCQRGQEDEMADAAEFFDWDSEPDIDILPDDPEGSEIFTK